MHSVRLSLFPYGRFRHDTQRARWSSCDMYMGFSPFTPKFYISLYGNVARGTKTFLIWIESCAHGHLIRFGLCLCRLMAVIQYVRGNVMVRFLMLCRFEWHRRLQIKIDPWPNMDAHLALFHLDAHVGRRRRQSRWQGTYAQATVRNQTRPIFRWRFLFFSLHSHIFYRYKSSHLHI